MDAYTLRHMRSLPVGQLRYSARHMAHYGYDPYNNHDRFAHTVRQDTTFFVRADGLVNIPDMRVM